MKLKWNLNQTETSLLENITNIGESNNREKNSTKQSVILLRKKEIFLQ